MITIWFGNTKALGTATAKPRDVRTHSRLYQIVFDLLPRNPKGLKRDSFPLNGLLQQVYSFRKAG